LVSHEHASLALAQRCSSVPTSAPLFTALLNYRHSTVDLDSGFSRNTGIRFISAESWTNYPIVFSVEQKHTDFVLDMETDSSVDPRRLLLYAVTGIRSLLDALERAPGAQALELETVPEAERRELTHSFDLSRGFEQDALIQELFEAQVRLRPSAIALTCDGRSLSYAELNGRANQLAWFLRARGVGSGDLVGICADRGPDLVVGLLGILKAGSAYVPLDPAYPRERLAFVLGDASPVVVLTQEALAPRIPVVNAELIRLDSDWPIIAQQPSVNPGLRPQGMTSSGVAYVIYTSGSTGAPKGVMVEHRNVVR